MLSGEDRDLRRPWLSIVTCVLNAPQLLAKTLDSIAAFDCAVEHIIIDGGSEAASAAVLERAIGQGARVLVEKDDGIYQALNKGVRLAQGRFIGILHAGDLCAPEALRVLHRSLATAGHDANTIYYGDCKLGERKVTAPSAVTPAMNLYNLSIAHQSLVVPRDVYERVGDYREDFKIVSDHMWMRAAFNAGVSFRKLSGWWVELDDAGLSSGQTAETRALFEREIVGRTGIYYPFLPERICRLIFQARTSQNARDELRSYVENSKSHECEPRVWAGLQEALYDYLEMFSAEARGAA